MSAEEDYELEEQPDGSKTIKLNGRPVGRVPSPAEQADIEKKTVIPLAE